MEIIPNQQSYSILNEEELITHPQEINHIQQTSKQVTTKQYAFLLEFNVTSETELILNKYC